MNQYQVSLVLGVHGSVLPGAPPEQRLTAIVGVYRGDLNSLWVATQQRRDQKLRESRTNSGAYFTEEEEQEKKEEEKRLKKEKKEAKSTAKATATDLIERSLAGSRAASVKRELAVDAAMEKVKAAVVGKPKSKTWLKKRRNKETLQLLNEELQEYCTTVYDCIQEAAFMLTKLSIVAKMASDHGFVWNETGDSSWGSSNWKTNGVRALQRHILLRK